MDAALAYHSAVCCGAAAVFLRGAILPELHVSLIAELASALGGLPARWRLVVGVSGGLDSMLLLAVAHRYVQAHPALSLLAVHVHHGLSPHADAWARHVEQQCAQLGVPCVVKHVDVDRRQASREAAARDARHAALASVLQPGDALLLAHHADDQAETVLLRLLRGSGLTGLAAMRASRPVAGVGDAWLVRPWLGISRASLHEAAVRAGLSWVEDESNADTRFDRNFLRREILPPLNARWPALVGTLSSTARRLAEADTLLAGYLDSDLAPLLALPARHDFFPTLDAPGLLAQDPPRQRALLRRWLQQIGAPLFHETWLAQLLALAASREDAEGELRVAGWEIHRFRGRLHAFPQLPAPATERVLHWDLRGELDLGPGHGVLRALPSTAGTGLPLAGIEPGMPVTVRFRGGGEMIRANAGSGRRPLKKILQEHDVPPWLRARLPLLYVDAPLVRSGSQPVAAGDLLADAAFTPSTAKPVSLCLCWALLV